MAKWKRREPISHKFIFYLNNARDTNFFTKFSTNCLCDEWLLVNEKSDVNDRFRWKPIRSWSYH